MAAAVLGIAVCAMYSAGALVLLDGLAAGTGSVLDRLPTGPHLAHRGSFPDLAPAPLPEGLQGAVAAGWLRPGSVASAEAEAQARLLALTDPSLLGLPALPAPGEAFLARPLAEALNVPVGQPVTVAGPDGEATLVLARHLTGGVTLPSGWVLLAPEELWALTGADPAAYDLLLLADRRDATRLATEGYDVLSLASAPDFFHAALAEARGLLLGVVGASALAVAVTAYSLLALEVRYRHDEIRTLRALGLDGGGLLRLYGLQVLFVVGSGAVLGLATGIVAAHGLVSFAPFFGLPTVIRPHLTAWGVLLPLLSALGAGAAGGFLSLAVHLGRDRDVAAA